ncbi:MFS transporter [Pseudomonas syringae pv. actinidifoliorum]|uniref:MFS transporter n=1 Tax=Pseudomonas syringae TaxID=317 RepID=UPI0013723283|nr:MFS transporter [Pseudomonas syringae pv. actinidifoliorum]NAT65263.1 MFS transporter [Pseudomonas syringae pv. actinidifoliorum]
MDRVGLPGLTVFRLALAQLISWGVTFYLPGAFGNAIADDLGWSTQRVFSGLSVALLVMALVSTLSAGLIQRFGARQVLQSGAGFNAAGCCILALCDSPQGWFSGWAVLGLGMRLSLYDALFAALAVLLGERSRPLMVQITLLGGLASAVFWPLGNGLLGVVGWRSAIAIYACLALLGGLLFSGLPDVSPGSRLQINAVDSPDGTSWQRQAGYALGMALIGFMSAGLSAHLPALLSGFGVPVGWVALWGVGQTCARLVQALLARSVCALRLNVWVATGLLLCFALAFLASGQPVLACLFVFGYGAMNGLTTLLRASLPFALFDPRHYARLQGRLLAPGFLLSAAAPWFFAWVRERYADRGLLGLSLSLSVVLVIVALLLQRYCEKARNCPTIKVQ